MSFCCGASMVGGVGAIKREQIVVHHVPLVFCPICHRVEVHYTVKEEFNILVDYAEGDGVRQINFSDYVDFKNVIQMMENCITVENGDAEQLYREQIDNALDLYGVAKQMGDREWQKVLEERLKVLSTRWKRHRQRKTCNG